MEQAGVGGGVCWGLQEPFQVSPKWASRHMTFRPEGCPGRSHVGPVMWVMQRTGTFSYHEGPSSPRPQHRHQTCKSPSFPPQRLDPHLVQPVSPILLENGYVYTAKRYEQNHLNAGV